MRSAEVEPAQAAQPLVSKMHIVRITAGCCHSDWRRNPPRCRPNARAHPDALAAQLSDHQCLCNFAPK
jgi:hypothetical protein